jgi:NADH dehydrogenase/NADH:ubiquinone oxidoreductase subunit G
MISFSVDGRRLKASGQANLLQVCLQNGIYIPNLCHLDGFDPSPASCRLCFVSIDGADAPVTACSLKPEEGMVVHTDTPQVRHLQRSGFRLLLSMHKIDCLACPANQQCALQDMARFLAVKLSAEPLDPVALAYEVDQGHPLVDYHPYRCVLCGRCVRICRANNDKPTLTFAGRGFATTISSLGSLEPDGQCSSCQSCVAICPVGALTLKPADPGAPFSETEPPPDNA